jgi:hypothetical protein
MAFVAVSRVAGRTAVRPNGALNEVTLCPPTRERGHHAPLRPNPGLQLSKLPPILEFPAAVWRLRS